MMGIRGREWEQQVGEVESQGKLGEVWKIKADSGREVRKNNRRGCKEK